MEFAGFAIFGMICLNESYDNKKSGIIVSSGSKLLNFGFCQTLYTNFRIFSGVTKYPSSRIVKMPEYNHPGIPTI
jgi:hypothetical protein